MQKDQSSYSGPPLDEVQEVMLLEDLRALAKTEGFNSEYQLRPLTNRSNHLRVLVPIDARLAELVIKFRSYPSNGLPEIELADADAVSQELAQRSKSDLATASMKLYRVADVVNALRKAGKQLRQESHLAQPEHQVQKRTSTDAANCYASLPTLLVDALVTSMQASLTASLTALVEPWLVASLVPPAKESERRHNGNGSLSANTPHQPQPAEAGSITKVLLPDVLLGKILRDGERHRPKEYAFLLSGILTPEGVGTVFSYYEGQMEVSTPTYCRLTEACITRVLYETMPFSHNLVIHGHIHPIEGVSGTDIHAFEELAEWDRQVARLGVIAKYSCALVICGHSQSVSVYDTHTKQEIGYMVVPTSVTTGAGGKGGYR